MPDNCKTCQHLDTDHPVPDPVHALGWQTCTTVDCTCIMYRDRKSTEQPRTSDPEPIPEPEETP